MRHRPARIVLLLLALFIGSSSAGDSLVQADAATDHKAPRTILEVGPLLRLSKPSEAAREAPDGALVMINAGYYLDDVAVWRQDRLRVVGIGGPVRIISRGITAEDKAIWVFYGKDVEVEHIELSGARSTHFNGAGISFQGTNLSLRHCSLHDNQMGLLTGDDPAGTVRIENSEFYRNTVDYKRHGRLGHNIYIGRIGRFVLRESYVHNARTGHLVKSRAHHNIILYNRLTDESGRASYLIDLAEGGKALIMGNLLHKSVGAESQFAISFAAEANQKRAGQELQVVYNTLVSERRDTVLVHNRSRASAVVANNLLQGKAQALRGKGRPHSNLILPEVGLADAESFDFALSPQSLAVDAGYRNISNNNSNDNSDN